MWRRDWRELEPAGLGEQAVLYRFRHQQPSQLQYTPPDYGRMTPQTSRPPALPVGSVT